jgi:outer membrane protein OmpA-like peptidoglycan-associated protein
MLETSRQAADETDGLGKLKTLLFRGESARLQAVEASVEALDRRVGDAPRLEAATSEILVEALRRAEVARHRELAQAIAPVVVAAIQNEIRNSRDMMVEALYPLTGQLVVAAVSNAFREVIEAMNERLDRLTSFDRWKLRARARLTGRPASELALAASTRPRLSRALFLERGSGALLASWRADGLPEERGELIGGLIAALTGFAREALGEGGGDLRTLDFGGRDIHLRASPTHIIACEFTGPPRTEQKAALDRACFAWLEKFGRDNIATDEAFGAFFDGAVVDAVADKSPRKPGWAFRVVVAAIALSLLALVARAGLHAWRERAIEAALAATVAARPALAPYPLRVETDHGAGKVALIGLAPSAPDVEALVASLKAAASGYAIEPRVALAATGEDIAATRERIATLAANIDATRASLRSLTSSSARADSLAALNARLDDFQRQKEALEKEVSGVDARTSALQARADAPRARLASLIDGFAIYFEREQPLDRPDRDDRLDAIAALLKETNQSLRVVGFSDDTGGEARNLIISRQRATAVAGLLVERGVPRERLSVVGRAANSPITDGGPEARLRNRRVVLELPLDGELAP